MTASVNGVFSPLYSSVTTGLVNSGASSSKRLGGVFGFVSAEEMGAPTGEAESKA